MAPLYGKCPCALDGRTGSNEGYQDQEGQMERAASPKKRRRKLQASRSESTSDRRFSIFPTSSLYLLSSDNCFCNHGHSNTIYPAPPPTQHFFFRNPLSINLVEAVHPKRHDRREITWRPVPCTPRGPLSENEYSHAYRYSRAHGVALRTVTQ